eukprot:1047449_1
MSSDCSTDRTDLLTEDDEFVDSITRTIHRKDMSPDSFDLLAPLAKRLPEKDINGSNGSDVGLVLVDGSKPDQNGDKQEKDLEPVINKYKKVENQNECSTKYK